MAREPGGKITRAAVSLKTAADEFTARLEHPKSWPDLSHQSQSNRESFERLRHEIQNRIQRILGTVRDLNSIKDDVERVAVGLTTGLDAMEKKMRMAPDVSDE